MLESKDFFYALIRNSPDGIAILGTDGTIRYVSPSVERLLGYTPDELTGCNARELINPDDSQTAVDAFTGVIRNPALSFSAEFRVRHKDGSWRVVEVAGSNRIDSPSIAGIVVSSRDVTERKKAEELLREAARQAENKRVKSEAVILAMDKIEEISGRKWAEGEREQLIHEIQDSLPNIRKLKGLIPMCAWCKKVREDGGHWKRVETYIQERSDASFTHGICPECLKKQDPSAFQQVPGNENRRLNDLPGPE